MRVFRCCMMPRLRRRAAWAPPVCPVETSSGENMLPSPSTRHITNGLSSYIVVSRLDVLWTPYRRNIRSGLCCFSLALPSVFLPPFSMPTPSCALENKIRSVISFRGRRENSIPLVQTSTCRSSSSFLSSKYLFLSIVDVKISATAERKKRCVQRRKDNPLSKLEPHQTVAGADGSWREMKKKLWRTSPQLGQ